jgi:uroporphyrinogen decarboxylase
MTSKERVLTAFAGSEPDRVPINYEANAGIDRRLKAHYGLEPADSEGLRVALDVDFRQVGAQYRGPKLHEDIPERGVTVDTWGRHRRWIEHETGGYWDYCDFPLQAADEQTVAEWPMPDPDNFDYARIPELCRQHAAYAIAAGGPGLGDIINSNGMLRGMEQTLVDLITEEPAGLLLARRRTEINLEIARRTLEAAGGAIDFLWMGEDLGTQIAPIMSLDLYRRSIRPLHQQFVDLAKSFGIPVMIHTCGSSSWAYEDFIEMGIGVVDTLQPEAAQMAPEYLKERFGGRLAFHGCISTAGPVATGTVEETVTYCRQTLETMMPGGGYCFAPTHQLQDNSPTENVVAMYETAKECGWYTPGGRKTQPSTGR